MKKLIKPGLIILISVFLGCETADDFGVKYPIDSNVKPSYIEIELPASNIFIDSLRTDNETFILSGIYQNSLTGNVEAEGYFNINYVSGSLPGDVIENNFIYDSVRLSFMSTESLVSNEESSQSLVFYELEETISQGLVYLATSKMEKVRQIGSTTFSVTDAEDTIYSNTILDDDFGMDLFARGKESGTLTSTWPSLGISPGIGSELINSILVNQDTCRLYMYITEPDGIVEEISGNTVTRDTTYQVEFTLSQGSFSNVLRDRSGSPFEGVAERMDFTLGDNKTIIDPLSGISTAFSLDGVNQFIQENSDIIINSAIILFDYDEDQNRETLENFMLYFRQSDLSVFSPAIELNQFGNIVADNDSYFRPVVNGQRNFTPEISVLNQDEINLNSNITFFLRNLLSTSSESSELQFQNPFVEEPVILSDLVMIGLVDSYLKRTVFKSEGIKLRIYYTEFGN